MEETLKTINNEKERLIFEEFNAVFKKNPTQKMLLKHNTIINRKNTDVDISYKRNTH